MTHKQKGPDQIVICQHERERERERERQTDRERQRQRQRDRDRETETERDRQTDRQTDQQRQKGPGKKDIEKGKCNIHLQERPSQQVKLLTAVHLVAVVAAVIVCVAGPLVLNTGTVTAQKLVHGARGTYS